MYLPQEIPNARVLITVKTYPQPSGKYGELICPAGLLDGEKWIRIYPVAFRFLTEEKLYPKYSWIELDLVRNRRDFRPESYRPKQGIDEEITVLCSLDTSNKWAARKDYVLKEVFTSISKLIHVAKSNEKKSLATLRPTEIINFVIEEDKRDWKEEWIALAKQGNIFEIDDKGQLKDRPRVPKPPYKYFYEFLTENDTKPHRMMIEDIEIGNLYWNCLKRTDGDEIAANQLVRPKYFDTFLEKNELYLFVGTTMQYHNVGPNPFIIVGIFYPPKTAQMSLF